MEDAEKKVKEMFGALGMPERLRGSEDVGTEGVTAQEGEPSTQMNVRMPLRMKRCVKLLAARDNLSISEVMLRAIALYQERYGAAPDV